MSDHNLNVFTAALNLHCKDRPAAFQEKIPDIVLALWPLVLPVVVSSLSLLIKVNFHTTSLLTWCKTISSMAYERDFWSG